MTDTAKRVPSSPDSALAEFAADLAAKQERLGPEFERVLFDNLEELYMTDVPSRPESADDRMRYALEEIIQAADLHRGTPPWVLIPDHLIEQAKRAVETGGAVSQ